MCLKTRQDNPHKYKCTRMAHRTQVLRSTCARIIFEKIKYDETERPGVMSPQLANSDSKVASVFLATKPRVHTAQGHTL